MSFQTLSISRSVAGEVAAGAQPAMAATVLPCTIRLSFYSVNRQRHIRHSSFHCTPTSSSGNNSIRSTNGDRESEEAAASVCKNEGNSRKKSRNHILKSLLGRGSMWKRILFASTKMRSIILLNVTTMIYGTSHQFYLNILLVDAVSAFYF